MSDEAEFDVWAPWAGCNRDAVLTAANLEDFREAIFALLDLAPKASARDLERLGWEPKHPSREFKALRDQWASAKAAAREQAHAENEPPLEDAAWAEVKKGVRTGDFKHAEQAIKTILLIRTAAVAKASERTTGGDDFSNLSDIETLVLGALVHKLREEPLTEFDEQAIAYIGGLKPAAP